MSYDISLTDPATGNTIILDKEHYFQGGTYTLNGTREAWLNVTYNYVHHFRQVFGDKGIRVIYGLTGTESIPLLTKAATELKDDVDTDYWKPTEGNAKAALMMLLSLARLCPDGIWKGD